MREIKDAMIESQEEIIKKNRELIKKHSSMLIGMNLMENTLQTILDFKFENNDRDVYTIKELIRTTMAMI